MAGEGDAERLVVLLEARIDGFQRDMQRAADTSDRDFTAIKRSSKSATAQMEADMLRSTVRINQALAQTSVQIGELSREMAASAAVIHLSSESMQEGSESASKGFIHQSLEVASLINHLKEAALAAYVLSPAFRGLVNPAIAAGFSATTAALGAMGPTAAGVAMNVGSRLAPALMLITRFAGPVLLVAHAFEAMNAITELGAQKIKELSELLEKATSSGVTVDFLQRITKAAEDIKLGSDTAADALKKLSDASKSKLGGDDLTNHLDELIKAGNFANNAGVQAYRSALTTEEKYRALVELITVAIESGERLAAIDLASKFLPPKMLDELRANGNVLKEIQERAATIKPVDIIDQQQIAYAKDLARRLEEATNTLQEKWKPLQNDFTQLGLNYKESWIAITEFEAKAVDLANDFVRALEKVPSWFAHAGNTLGNALQSLPTWLGGGKPDAETLERYGMIPKGEPGFSDTNNAFKSGFLTDSKTIREQMMALSELNRPGFAGGSNS